MSLSYPLFAAERLHHGFRSSTLGLVAVAVGDRGIAAIPLGSDQGRLRQALACALPGTTLLADDGESTLGAAPTAVGGVIDEPGRLRTDDGRAMIRGPKKPRRADGALVGRVDGSRPRGAAGSAIAAAG